MRRPILLTGIAFVLLAGCSKTYVQNPDPNHMHADFAVWVDDEKLDFSASELMAGLSSDEQSDDEEGEYLREHLPLHDSIGNVIHRRKPGLTVGQFFESLD